MAALEGAERGITGRSPDGSPTGSPNSDGNARRAKETPKMRPNKQEARRPQGGDPQ